MISYAAQPPGPLDLLMLVEPLARLLGLDPRRLSKEHQLWLLDEAEHRREIEQLSEARANLICPEQPEPGEDRRHYVKESGRWRSDHRWLSALLFQEDCCHSLPMADEFGECFPPKDPEHWLRAPGVDASQFGVPTQLKKGTGHRGQGTGKNGDGQRVNPADFLNMVMGAQRSGGSNG